MTNTTNTPKTETTKQVATTTAAPAQATAPKVEVVKDEFTGKTPGELFGMFGGNKSATMRAMLAKGYTCGQISKALNVRYQFVNNVKAEVARKKD